MQRKRKRENSPAAVDERQEAEDTERSVVEDAGRAVEVDVLVESGEGNLH